MSVQTAGAKPTVAIVVFLAGCSGSDLGEPCSGQQTTLVAPDPIAGEVPQVEVVRLTRDAGCEGYACVRHHGLEPYCTAPCELDQTGEDTAACARDDDCLPHQRCAPDQRCRLDPCPAGFSCHTVQDVGPLAGRTFCVRDVGCTEHLQCRDLGELECVEHVCYDACNLLPEPQTCELHQRVCEPAGVFFTHAECQCSSGRRELHDCRDVDVACRPESTDVDFWAPGAGFGRMGVCLRARPGRLDPIGGRDPSAL